MLIFKSSVVAAFSAIVITAAALARTGDGDSDLLKGRTYDDEGNPYGFVPVGYGGASNSAELGKTTAVAAILSTTAAVGIEPTNSVLTGTSPPAATSSTMDSSYPAPSGYEYPASADASFTSTVVITRTTTISKEVATTFILKTSTTPSLIVLISSTNQSTSATMVPLPKLVTVEPIGSTPAVSYLRFTYTPEPSGITSTGANGNATMVTGTISGGGMALSTGDASSSAESNVTVAVSPTASSTPLGSDGGQTLEVSVAMVALVIGNMAMLL
ncbi:MAG: hypothetical protein M1829_002352 [Trizodia sp. TS-e1964]|nr:MAG: hypothetical protein M1829_002352 [Trizodia sp. TS-e1964]